MKPSKLLRLAIDQYLWDGLTLDAYGERPDGKRAHLCLAVSLAADSREHKRGYKTTLQSAERIKRYITRQIDGHIFFDGWLCDRHGITPRQKDQPKLQATRKAWAEDMIKRYEALGL